MKQMNKNIHIRHLCLNISLIVFSTVLLSSCNLKPQSKLIRFNYGGFGDTIFAFLDGKIYETNLLNNVPLDSVRIKILSKKNVIYPQIYDHIYQADLFYPKDTVFYSNKAGNVSISFIDNYYVDIVISKKGYQTLTLKNYHAHPDQSSSFEAILRKGSGSIAETIIEKD